ncbi:DUF72 domain-containing protein [Komagataeibacter sucrofermentans]|uniref:DUF72 domain-containing protein n=1 Tax=Komagataeibacter sucrofermentans TaxID=1053551 RepID=A0A318QMV4_9PROT|nr:DUF72 domain-containing protein [Komagataeibacter sucrofermentans]PYD80375.1 hypothetical protein CFR77_02945 [Komagataeibacter sucrofermentans]GBQ47249.1 hypothetical protein AA15973_1149 [Komagataeibacter sucrofermentans DSM 15973]
MSIRVGIAGWSTFSAMAKVLKLPVTGTQLERYAAYFSTVEINSSFYRPHRRTTYARWAASVPPAFRFSVKLPRTITHEHRLDDCQALIDRFAEETDGLGEKRGPVLVQFPPSFAYPGDVAVRFFQDLRVRLAGAIVVEPRHASWFLPTIDNMLAGLQISRVAADPGRSAPAAQPGGWGGLVYFRLHGSPDIYKSRYTQEAVEAHAKVVAALAARGTEVWTIYDNTTYGAAVQNGFELMKACTGIIEN